MANDTKLNLNGLRELFGRAIMAIMVADRGSFHLGKHYRTRGAGGGRKGKHHPAGTKLVRSFIRRGNGENTAMRLRYAELTGHQYGA